MRCSTCGMFRRQGTPEGDLTKREREVLELIVKGKTNAAIAEALFVTEKTIKFHVTGIYAKEGVRTRAELIVKHFQPKAPRDANGMLPEGVGA